MAYGWLLRIMDDLDFDILSLNVRGLGDHTKRRKIFNYAKKHVSRKGVIFCKKPILCKRMNRYGQTSLVVVQVQCSSLMESQTLEEFQLPSENV